MCPECGKACSAKSGFRTHKMTHTRDRPLYIKDVGNPFSKNPSELTPHHQTHTGEKPYVCQECGKWFSKTCHLNAHGRIQEGPRTCSECAKTCWKLYNFSLHQKTHTGEKHNVCSDSGKALCQKSVLRIYPRIHTGALHMQ